MASVRFTSALRRFYPDLSPQDIEGDTVAVVLDKLDQSYPGLKTYLVDERGRLRKHVNIYIGEDLIRDRERLGDAVRAGDEILIFQALSGG